MQLICFLKQQSQKQLSKWLSGMIGVRKAGGDKSLNPPTFLTEEERRKEWMCRIYSGGGGYGDTRPRVIGRVNKA